MVARARPGRRTRSPPARRRTPEAMIGRARAAVLTPEASPRRHPRRRSSRFWTPRSMILPKTDYADEFRSRVEWVRKLARGRATSSPTRPVSISGSPISSSPDGSALAGPGGAQGRRSGEERHRAGDRRSASSSSIRPWPNARPGATKKAVRRPPRLRPSWSSRPSRPERPAARRAAPCPIRDLICRPPWITVGPAEAAAMENREFDYDVLVRPMEARMMRSIWRIVRQQRGGRGRPPGRPGRHLEEARRGRPASESPGPDPPDRGRRGLRRRAEEPAAPPPRDPRPRRTTGPATRPRRSREEVGGPRLCGRRSSRPSAGCPSGRPRPCCCASSKSSPTRRSPGRWAARSLRSGSTFMRGQGGLGPAAGAAAGRTCRGLRTGREREERVMNPKTRTSDEGRRRAAARRPSPTTSRPRSPPGCGSGSPVPRRDTIEGSEVRDGLGLALPPRTVWAALSILMLVAGILLQGAESREPAGRPDLRRVKSAYASLEPAKEMKP
ncbi:MAG: hypothetical protein MZU91_11460 [Desulfosudis oleivorans]|nr:hypothetical protein [Desulfosudis oleivorans]